MNKLLSCAAFGMCAAATIAPVAEAQQTPLQKPNIILIYADDIGYGDIGCYGASDIPTPNTDRLAREGLRFTDAHCTSATCTPSRYSLLTGEYAFRKPGTNILDGDAGIIIEIGRQTLPLMLRSAGYSTGVVGKWHLGLGGKEGPQWNAKITPNPQDTGFDYHFIFPATADRVPSVFVENGRVLNLDPNDPIEVDYKNPVDDGPTGAKNPELVRMKSDGPQHNASIINGVPRIGFMSGGKAALWKDEELASTFTQQAQGFIERQPANKPFFLYFATHNNHVPRVPDPRFVGKTKLGPRGDAVVEFDWMVGEILETLTRLKLSDNTLVILSSDNGPIGNDGYFDDSVRLLGDHKPAGPFRGGKYNIAEGGTRIPFIVRWPGHVQPGVSDALISQVDLIASLSSLTGQKLDAQTAPDSQNQLAALLGNSKVGRRDLVELATGQSIALRSGNWKFIPTQRNGAPQLYDVSIDPGETKNLALQNPEKVAELSARLQTLRTGAAPG